MKFKITTLGCKVNAYESQFYCEELEKLGFEQTEDVADIYIINTCTVTNTAASKSRQKVHQAKKENPDAIVVVVGCYVQVIDKEKRDELDVDLVIGAKNKKSLPTIVQDYVENQNKMDLVESTTDFQDFEAMPIACFESKHRAFLKVQDGCNQFCSYCAIPFARGRERCLHHDEVIQIAKNLVEKGHSEIVLTGIHTGRYFDGEYNLAKLLGALLENTPSHIYYRISSIEITEVSDELIQLMQQSDRVCHHLHIPVQSACNETLKRMNRPYTIEYFKERVNYIRECVPDISISTDVIAGFVQESDEEFDTTVQNIKDIAFSFLHVFPYSKRDGTKASKMNGELNGKIKKERVNTLLQLSKELRYKDMMRFNPVQVLVEDEENGIYNGYTNHYHPIKIKADNALTGRLEIEWNTIEDDTYIAERK